MSDGVVVLNFFVPGIPIPQGSKKIVPTAQGPRLIDTQSAALRKWRNAIAEAARYYRGVKPTITGEGNALRVEATFTFARPASAARKRIHPAVTPDGDKLLRACLDALTAGGVYRDDAMVVTAVTRKRYVGHADAARGPGVHIIVWLED